MSATTERALFGIDRPNIPAVEAITGAVTHVDYSAALRRPHPESSSVRQVATRVLPLRQAPRLGYAGGWQPPVGQGRSGSIAGGAIRAIVRPRLNVAGP